MDGGDICTTCEHTEHDQTVCFKRVRLRARDLCPSKAQRQYPHEGFVHLLRVVSSIGSWWLQGHSTLV